MASTSMDKFNQWFASLKPRERALVTIAGGLSVIVLFYFMVWAPLANAINENTTALKNEQDLVAWVEEQAVRAKRMQQTTSQQTISGSLTQIVNQTARNTNITISRMQPQGEELQVLIDLVSFNDLIQWLDTLEQRGIVIIQSDIAETQAPGIVQVRRLQLGKQL